MAQPLRVLVVEDNPADAELLIRELHRAGFAPEWQRVDTEAAFLEHLHAGLDLVLSDYQMPRFSGLRALELLKKSGLDVPLIIVSGTIGEDTAVAAMKEGATDYLLKDRLARLGPIVSQAVEQSGLRRERRQTETALRESEDRFATLFRSSPVALALATQDEGRLVDVNDAWVRLTGCRREEAVGSTTAELKLIDPAERTRIFALMTAQPQAQIEFGMTTPSGRRCSAIASIARVTLAGKPHRLGAIVDITERKQAEENLRKAHDLLRTFAQRRETIREQERTTIAREIHDILAQELTRLKIDLVWLAKRLARPIEETARPELLTRIHDAAAQADSAISTVQRIATELRPVILDSLGLPAAVEWQTEDFSRRTGLKCVATAPRGESALSRERATAVFRILQESLTNIARHSKATAVEVRLLEDAVTVTLIVHDNGRGISDAQLADPHSIGLIGMRERADAFGGTLEIRGGPGTGTTVTARMPVDGSPE